jgi:hypothetical protein
VQGFGPNSSLDLATLPIHSSAIFPIAEESGLYRDISGVPM